MKGVPLYCDRCKETLTTNRIFGGPGSANITFENVRVSCPKCGYPARVLDGQYQYNNTIVELLSGPDITKEKLKKLSKIIENAKTNKSSAAEIAQVIDKEIPELSGIKKFLPKNPTDLNGYLSALILIIGTLITGYIGKQQVELGYKQIQLGVEQLKVSREANEISKSKDTELEETKDRKKRVVTNPTPNTRNKSFLPKRFRKKKRHK